MSRKIYRTPVRDNARALCSLLALEGFTQETKPPGGWGTKPIAKKRFRLTTERRSDGRIGYRVTYHSDGASVERREKTYCQRPYCWRRAHGHGLCNKHYRQWKYRSDESYRLAQRRRSARSEARVKSDPERLAKRNAAKAASKLRAKIARKASIA